MKKTPSIKENLSIIINLFILLFFLNFSSCKKHEKDYEFTAGESKKMMVTDLQKSVEIMYEGEPYQADSVFLDLDKDGENDIIGLSILDTIIDYNAYRELSINVINNDFVFSEIENSGRKIAVYSHTETKYEGVFPSVTSIYEITCDYQTGHDTFYTSNSPKYLLEGEDLNESDFNWATSYDTKINLKIPPYFYAEYQASVGGDSIIGVRFNYDPICDAIPENETVFLPFIKQEGVINRYGWIKLKVNGHKITFIESAIQPT